MKTNVNLKTIVTLTHTSPIHTVKLPYLCSARFANSPPLIILTERSTCALKTQKDSAAAPKEAWRVTWQSWRLMFSYAPGSNFQTTMVELSVAVMMVLLILQTQANMLFILYKRILTMVNSNEQPVCAIRSTSDERFKRSSLRFEIERCRDLQPRKQRRLVLLNQFVWSLEGECGRERDHTGLSSGQMSSTISMKTRGGIIFICRKTHLTLWRSLLIHTWGAGQQTGERLWNLGFDLPLLWGGLLHQVNTNQLLYFWFGCLPCVCIGSPSHSSTEKGPFKRFVDLPNGTRLQETDLLNKAIQCVLVP